MCPSNEAGAPVVEANPAGDAAGPHPAFPAPAHPPAGDSRRTGRDRPAGRRLRQAPGRDGPAHRRGAAGRVLQGAGTHPRPRTGCWSAPASAGTTGVVGKASIGADLASPAGFALRTGKPVISNHLENEERFRTPEILAQHGIHRAMNVILQGDGRPFGVLEVDSRSEDEFVEHDLAFLQGAANILGMAIERERHARNLEAALERHQVLLKEMGHRVKNSLMIVTSMLQLQARDIGDPTLTLHLEEAAHRVSAVARAHDQLFQGADIERMDIGKYVEGSLQGPRRQRGPLRHPHRGAVRDRDFRRSRHLGGAGRQRADRQRGQACLPRQAGRKDPGQHCRRGRGQARRFPCATKARACLRVSTLPGRRASACGSSPRS